MLLHPATNTIQPEEEEQQSSEAHPYEDRVTPGQLSGGRVDLSPPPPPPPVRQIKEEEEQSPIRIDEHPDDLSPVQPLSDGLCDFSPTNVLNDIKTEHIGEENGHYQAGDSLTAAHPASSHFQVGESAHGGIRIHNGPNFSADKERDPRATGHSGDNPNPVIRSAVRAVQPLAAHLLLLLLLLFGALLLCANDETRSE
ncbi:hypothetical protein CRUP_026375 [Coryphaenoides rupestris]|nr:hypothetical protein CRUP_026375 [Coryphaenoides rupestris]